MLEILDLLASAQPARVTTESALYLISFVAVVSFILVGYTLFSQGWQSYEQQYIADAEQTLDDLFLAIPAQQLLFLSFACSFGSGVLTYLLFENGMVSVILGIMMYFAPKKLLKFYKDRRTRKFTDQLVEALNTLNNALRSGFTLPKAFQLIAQQMPKPISQEFKIVVQELRLGMEVDQALTNLYKRVPSQDLDLLITAIGIASDIGGNLTEVFEKISFTIRERHRIEGRIEALTSQGKMQGIVVGLLPAGMFVAIYIFDPKTIEPLYTTWIGYGIMACIIVMEYLGYFFIKKIVNIDI